jgi:hypothetical protein
MQDVQVHEGLEKVQVVDVQKPRLCFRIGLDQQLAQRLLQRRKEMEERPRAARE